MSASFSRLTLAGIAVTLSCATVAPASAQTLARKDLSIDGAVTIATVALATCKAKGFNVSVAVVGRTGELLVHLRGDNTGPHTMDNSFRKAYTSRTSRAPSGDMTKRLKDNPQLSLVTLPNMIASQGALPIKIGEDVVGAVGVSGAPSPGGVNDEACAKAGIDKVADQLK